MLRSLRELEGYALGATDGEIGKVVDFLFDDERWAIRYLVADTGGWLSGRRVLLSPMSLAGADWSTRCLRVMLSRERIQNSPSIDAERPVSRRKEQEYSRYLGYPYYWGYPGVWGMSVYPMALATEPWLPALDEDYGAEDESEETHLRSARAVRGYRVEASDDSAGHVEDYVVDDETWLIRYLVIDIRHYWFGKRVLIAPQWASSISWERRKVHVDLQRRELEGSPEWDPSAGVNRDFESKLYDYYGRPAYWADTPPEVTKPGARRQPRSGRASPP